MKMNTKVRYGLRALIEISSREKNTGVLQKEISDKQEIPLKYLDIIIAGLRSAGLIVNYSGKRSGYLLTKPPHHISVYEVYRAFEPELTMVNCTCPGNECNRIDICPAKDYWAQLSNHIKKQMESTTVAQIISNYNSKGIN